MNGERLRVGVILQISGAESDRGEEMNAGISRIMQKTNREGGIRGRKVEIIVGNGMEDEAETLLVAKKLLEMDYAHVVICEAGRWITSPVVRAAERGRTPLLLYGENAAYPGVKSDWVFKIPGSGKEGLEELSGALKMAFVAMRKTGPDKVRIKKILEENLSAR